MLFPLALAKLLTGCPIVSLRTRDRGTGWVDYKVHAGLAMVSSSKSTWQLIISGISQGWILGLIIRKQ